MNNLIFKKITLLLSIAVIVVFSNLLNAEVKIKLIEGKKFQDYQISGYSKTKSLDVLQKDLKELFTKTAKEYLKDDNNLEIDITNVDLPGIYHYSYGPTNKDLRIVDSSSSYKLYFDYRVLSSSGELLKEGSHKIRDFFDSALIVRKNRNRGTVGYYETELVKWFKGLSNN